MDELDSGAGPRAAGGGRKRAAVLDPGLRPALLALAGPGERGDPVSSLRWTTKSTRTPAGELTRQGHRVGAVPLDAANDSTARRNFVLIFSISAGDGIGMPRCWVMNATTCPSENAS